MSGWKSIFSPEEGVTRSMVRDALDALMAQCESRSFELKETGSGYRLQTRQGLQQWVAKHHEGKPPKYSRAFLETLSLIAWRQPITRAEIEEIRGRWY